MSRWNWILKPAVQCYNLIRNALFPSCVEISGLLFTNIFHPHGFLYFMNSSLFPTDNLINRHVSLVSDYYTKNIVLDHKVSIHYEQSSFIESYPLRNSNTYIFIYRSGTINSKSFVGKVFASN